MAELHDLLEREAIRVAPSPDWAGSVRQRVRRRERRRKVGVIVVAIAILVPAAVLVREAFSGSSRSTIGGPDSGRVSPSPVPPITGTTLSGATFGPSDYRGKTVVFATWASWCPTACRNQLQIVQAAQDALQNPDVLFVGVDVKDKKDAASALVKRLGISFDSVMDPNGSLVRRLGLIGTPSTLVAGPDGRVRFRFEGGPTKQSGMAAAESRLVNAVRSISASTHPVTVQRYFFNAYDSRGIIEVNTSPPSVCYSTNSSPSRPISIVVHAPGVLAHTEVSFEPHDVDFCGPVRDALARDLIADPANYQIRWTPKTGQKTAFSLLIPQSVGGGGSVRPGTVTVPNVAGLPLGDARVHLQQAGLVVVVIREQSSDVARGIVMGSNPPPGSWVKKGGAVAVTVAQ